MATGINKMTVKQREKNFDSVKLFHHVGISVFIKAKTNNAVKKKEIENPMLDHLLV